MAGEDKCFEVGKSEEEKKEERIDSLKRQLLVLQKKMDFYEKYAHKHGGPAAVIEVKISGV